MTFEERLKGGRVKLASADRGMDRTGGGGEGDMKGGVAGVPGLGSQTAIGIEESWGSEAGTQTCGEWGLESSQEGLSLRELKDVATAVHAPHSPDYKWPWASSSQRPRASSTCFLLR